jgi:hypothetical protein
MTVETWVMFKTLLGCRGGSIMARRIPRYQREANQASERAKPPRRVAADLLEQGPTTSLSECPLFYEDLEFTCIDCGVDEVWTASDTEVVV